MGSTAYIAYTEVADHFGPGRNGPVIAVATLPDGTTSDQAAAKQVEIGTSLSRQLGVGSVVPVGESADHTTLAFQLILTTGPADATTVDTVQMIKDSAPAIGMDSGSTVSVTGQTVANIEISQRLGAALPIYLALVVGLSLLILMVVFRSVVVPLVATGGFLLSVAASFGATVAVYQWGWLGSLLQVQTPGPILSFMPIILIGVLFGLAMDYQMFLVSGMHEAYAHGEDPRTAVRSGFIHGAKVVTAAAVIMTSVFGGFVFAHLTMIRPIGLRPRRRRPRRRGARPDDPDARPHAPARPPRLVDARPSATHHPRPRRRGHRPDGPPRRAPAAHAGHRRPHPRRTREGPWHT